MPKHKEETNNSLNEGQGELTLGKIKITYGFLCTQGDQVNKDRFSIRQDFALTSSDACFTVCDGYGKGGAVCAEYVSKRIPSRIAHDLIKKKRHSSDKLSQEEIIDSCSKAYKETHEAILRNPDTNRDIHVSGSTCTCAIFFGEEKRLFISNVGDSRAVLGRKSNSFPVHHITQPLSYDQNLYRGQERKRIRETQKARILTMDQVDSLAPVQLGINEQVHGTQEHHEYRDLIEGVDVETGWRIWTLDEDWPGMMATRTIGGKGGQELGVIPDPEMVVLDLHEEDEIVVLATDGIFEFLTNQGVIDICSKSLQPGQNDTNAPGPLDACKAVIKTSEKYFHDFSYIKDDMTCIVIFIQHLPS